MTTGTYKPHRRERVQMEVLELDGTDVTATAAEINAAADVSGRIVNVTGGSVALTAATHEGRIVTIDKADGCAVTLPAASGSGGRYKVVITTAISSNSTTISAANGSDSFIGGAVGSDDDGEGATGYTWKADSGDDRVTMNGASQGGEAGDFWTFEDVAANTWLVFGYIKQSGGSEATPFSAAVS